MRKRCQRTELEAEKERRCVQTDVSRVDERVINRSISRTARKAKHSESGQSASIARREKEQNKMVKHYT